MRATNTKTKTMAKRTREEEQDDSSSASESSDSSESESEADSGSGSDAAGEDKKKKVAVKQSEAPKVVKSLPPGYTCNACGAVDDHAIYNCPKKIKKKMRLENGDAAIVAKSSTSKNCGGDSTNSKGSVESSSSSGQTEEQAANRLTAFLSGLPFDVKKTDVIKLINDADISSVPQAKDIRLVMFEDNTKKCKGLAYIKFGVDTDLEKFISAVDGQQMGTKTLKVEKAAAKKATAAVLSSSSGSVADKQHKRAQTARKADATAALKSKQNRCYRCGKLHDPATCTNPRICYKCGKEDHLSKDCPKRKGK